MSAIPDIREGFAVATEMQETPKRPPATTQPYNGDRMTQAEFHSVYKQTPKDFKAELVAGRVYLSSPMKIDHAENTAPLAGLLNTYRIRTPGVQLLIGGTIILGEEDEPQPDLCLRIRPEYGGTSRTSDDGYVVGDPEFVAEIAFSSKSIDLHDKRVCYAANGILEYLVLNLHDNRPHWFDLREDRELQPDADEVSRIRTFPGLWIHGTALLKGDDLRLLGTLDQGLATPEHEAFVARLAAQKR